MAILVSRPRLCYVLQFLAEPSYVCYVLLAGGCVTCTCLAKGGVFSEPTFSFYPFFQDLAQLLPNELTHVRASPGDCAAGWAQAWREI